jgi:hypothetical protein
VQLKCHACGRVGSVDGIVGRRDECGGCGAHLHCCRNCAFYDESAYNQCNEPSAERVVDKEAANFCDWFRPSAGAGAGARGGGGHAALEDLFKEKK